MSHHALVQSEAELLDSLVVADSVGHSAAPTLHPSFHLRTARPTLAESQPDLLLGLQA